VEAQWCAVLEAKNGRLQADLDAAVGEAERLATAACKHLVGAVDGGTCRACGQDL
jgi:hypothetical protein